MTTAGPLPAGLRDRVLAAAARERAAGRPVPLPPAINPADAFGRVADAFAALLAGLDDDQWGRPALRGLDVQGLVGHLIGVELDFQRAVTGDADVACAEHVASTQPDAEGQAGRRPDETRADWRAAADTTLRLVAAENPGRETAMHGMRLPLGALLVVRAFELWVHENDIRAAAGLPPSVPDTAVLALMTDLAVGLLPHGMARIGADTAPLELHLVLTGPGGGTWDVALGTGAGDGVAVPEVMVVADAVGFCRLVADRIGPSALDPLVRGAPDRAAEVFRAAAALALD
jgi:uncharacterized protein (TIGR03083 family)